MEFVKGFLSREEFKAVFTTEKYPLKIYPLTNSSFISKHGVLKASDFKYMGLEFIYTKTSPVKMIVSCKPFSNKIFSESDWKNLHLDEINSLWWHLVESWYEEYRLFPRVKKLNFALMTRGKNKEIFKDIIIKDDEKMKIKFNKRTVFLNLPVSDYSDEEILDSACKFSSSFENLWTGKDITNHFTNFIKTANGEDALGIFSDEFRKTRITADLFNSSNVDLSLQNVSIRKMWFGRDTATIFNVPSLNEKIVLLNGKILTKNMFEKYSLITMAEALIKNRKEYDYGTGG